MTAGNKRRRRVGGPPGRVVPEAHDAPARAGGRAIRPDIDRTASSAEFVRPAPLAARAVFGGALPTVERYATLLATDGVHRGLIGPREVPRLWERHLLNSAAIESLLPDSADVLDLGSGAGLPGVVIAIQRPDLAVTLLESQQRRTAFLDECVAELGLANVSVVRARAEQAVGLLVADIVVARAVAPLSRLTRWAVPLLRPGGRLLAVKGNTARRELDEAMPVLWDLGVVDAQVVAARLSAPEARATVVVLTMSDSRA